MSFVISRTTSHAQRANEIGVESNTFIPALGGLRGLAAVLVFVSHSSQRGLIPDFLGNEAGHLGVMLFFTLSAFLLTILYFHKKPTKEVIQNYWVARFGRVYPLHFILLTLAVVVGLLNVNKEIFPFAISLKTYLQNIFLIGRFNVFWTISTEFQFYLLFCFSWYLVHRTGKPTQFMVIVASITSLAVFVDIYPFTAGPIYKTIHFFSVGILAGLMVQSNLRARFQLLPDILLGILLILFILSTPIPSEKILRIEYNGFWSPWLLSLSFAIVFCCSISKGPVSAILGSRLGIILGDLSFGIYLLHIPIIHLVRHLLNGQEAILIFGTASALTILLAALCYRFLEKPTRVWIRKKYSTPIIEQ